MWPGAQFALEPRARQRPLALDRGRRDVEGLGCLADRQAAEETEFDHLCRPGVEIGQPRQGLVECEQVDGGLVGAGHILVERQTDWRIPTFDRGPRAAALHQNPAHGDRRDGGKVRAIFPWASSGSREPEIGFVDERCGLDGLSRRIVPDITPGHPTQLLIHERHQHGGGFTGGGIGGTVVPRPVAAVRPAVARFHCHGRAEGPCGNLPRSLCRVHGRRPQASAGEPLSGGCAQC